MLYFLKRLVVRSYPAIMVRAGVLNFPLSTPCQPFRTKRITSLGLNSWQNFYIVGFRSVKEGYKAAFNTRLMFGEPIRTFNKLQFGSTRVTIIHSLLDDDGSSWKWLHRVSVTFCSQMEARPSTDDGSIGHKVGCAFLFLLNRALLWYFTLSVYLISMRQAMIKVCRWSEFEFVVSRSLHNEKRHRSFSACWAFATILCNISTAYQ